MPDDYYQILGVSRDCSPDELKRSYRRLARRYHPDVCREDGAEERFKEISNAYAVLSDPQRRMRYDRYGDDNGRASAGAPSDIFDIFNQVFGGRGGPFDSPFGTPGGAQMRGGDLQYEITVDLQGVIEGVEAEVEVTRQTECDRCGGSGAAPSSAPETCHTCDGQGVVIRERATLLGVMATQSTCPRCHGRGTVITDPCGQCAGSGVTQTKSEVLVNVPAGIQDGQRIRMAGHGDLPPGGGIPGDLIIGVRVEPHPLLRRREKDLIMDLEISFSQAALGDLVIVPTVDGETEVTIPPGSQHGDTVVLGGLGLPPLHGGRRGRQIVNLQVRTPTDLDAEQRQLLAELALRRGESIEPPEHEGLFERIKKVLTGET